MLIKSSSPHGGDIYRNRVEIDFSANVNPFGMPPAVKKAASIAAAAAERYPDPYCTELRAKLAGKYGVSPDSILCGNGAAELIYSFAYALPKSKPALIISPAFCEYGLALDAAEVPFENYVLSAESGFLPDEALLSVDFSRYSAVFICSPANPTGVMVESGYLTALADRCEAAKTRLFCDLCFVGLSDNPGSSIGLSDSNGSSIGLSDSNGSSIGLSDSNGSSGSALSGGSAPSDSSRGYDVADLSGRFPHAVFLGAFTKTYAMAGLRLGYAISGDFDFLVKMSQKTQCWNVSSPAQAAGVAALSCEDWLADKRALILAERNRLTDRLLTLGIKAVRSRTNFILFRSDIPLYRLLLEKRLLTRPCADYIGLDSSYLRVAVRTPRENDILLRALTECLQSGNTALPRD